MRKRKHWHCTQDLFIFREHIFRNRTFLWLLFSEYNESKDRKKGGNFFKSSSEEYSEKWGQGNMCLKRWHHRSVGVREQNLLEGGRRCPFFDRAHTVTWDVKERKVGEGWEKEEKQRERERLVLVSLLRPAIYLWLCSRPSCCWFKVRSLAVNQPQGCEKHPHSHFTCRGKQKGTKCLWNGQKSQTWTQCQITFAADPTHRRSYARGEKSLMCAQSSVCVCYGRVNI